MADDTCDDVAGDHGRHCERDHDAGDGDGSHRDGPGADASDGDVPGGLKAVLDRADERVVNDEPGARPRLLWSSVTDTGGARASAADTRSSGSDFKFDLGGALARIAGEEPPSSTDEDPAEGDSTGDGHPAGESARDAPSADDEDDPAGALPTRPRSAPTGDTTSDGAVTADSADSAEDADRMAASDVASDHDARPRPPRSAPMTWDSVAEPSADSSADPLPTRSHAPADPLPTRSGRDDPSSPASDTVADADSPPDYPRRTPGASLDAQMREERPAETPDAPTRPHPPTSVFDDAVGVPGAPALPGAPSPDIRPAAPVPTLPASNPAAPPPVVTPVSSAPSTPDVNALRSAQLRQTRQQRKGKLFARLLLAFVAIGGLIAAALLFGRSLLFPTEWDAELTPIVNEVEAARGAEFERAVPLRVIPPAEFGERIRTATVGDGWVDQVPQWRALGLATGAADAESVAASLSASAAAFYDARTDTIYRADGVSEERAAADLRASLEAAYDRQADGATATPAEPAEQPVFTGVSTLDSIAARAVDELVAARGALPARSPADETLPLPISYELAAIDALGPAVLDAAGAEVTDVTLGDPPPTIDGVLDDSPSPTAAALMLPGDVSLVAPTALGVDDWSLVWGARLPETTVATLTDRVVADAYRVVERDGVQCALAVFDTANADDGSTVFAAMLAWAAAAPPASRAVATALSETRVQLDACDPGPEAGQAPNVGAVDALIDRQIARLTG